MSSQEQPEDQPPAEETAEDEPSAGAENDHDDDKPPTEDERLDQLTERIEKARTQAEDAGVLADNDDDGDEYVDSGATDEEDDQTITPPG